MLFLTCDLVFLSSDDYDICHYSSRVLHTHYVHVIAYVHDLLSHDLVFLSIYITVRVIIYSFQYSTYIAPLLLHFHIIVSSFRVCTCWSASDRSWFFSIRAWGDRWATVRRNLGRLPGVSLKFLVLCILAFYLVMMTPNQNCIFCISTLLCF